jgi:hypothetical protein
MVLSEIWGPESTDEYKDKQTNSDIYKCGANLSGPPHFNHNRHSQQGRYKDIHHGCILPNYYHYHLFANTKSLGETLVLGKEYVGSIVQYLILS